MAKRVKVLLAEGHLYLGDTICQFLKEHPLFDWLGTVEDGEQLRTFLSHNTEIPQVILLDGSMDLKEDFYLSKWVINNAPCTRLVAWIEKDDLYMLQRMAASGVTQFLKKPSTFKEISESLLDISGKDQVYSRTIPYYMEDVGSEISVPIPTVNTTVLEGEETRVLKMIVNHYSAMEIRTQTGLGRSELDAIVTSLKSKTNATSSLDLRRYALKHVFS